MKFKRANIYIALFLFFFSREKYLSLAINHNMAVNLEAADTFMRYEKGEYPEVNWEIEAKESARKASIQISRGFYRSFALMSAISIVALSCACINGSINPSFPVNYTILYSFMGAFIAGWGTLMELGGGFATFKGKGIHELIHPALFKILFTLGVFLIFLGLVI